MSFYAKFTEIRPIKFKINNSIKLIISQKEKKCAIVNSTIIIIIINAQFGIAQITWIRKLFNAIMIGESLSLYLNPKFQRFWKAKFLNLKFLI